MTSHPDCTTSAFVSIHPADVAAVAAQLRGAGIAATDAKLYPIYAPDYSASCFIDPDGIRLAITNDRQERRERHDNW
jgi:glyoxylase I family protein